MRAGERVFVDTGAWIALAERADPLHPRAVDQWLALQQARARLFVSVPVLLETFTFIDRKGSRADALKWRDALKEVERLSVLECSEADLAAAWPHLDRKELHKLTLVDATSFVLMRKAAIRTAFTFDTHFAVAGFRCLG